MRSKTSIKKISFHQKLPYNYQKNKIKNTLNFLPFALSLHKIK